MIIVVVAVVVIRRVPRETVKRKRIRRTVKKDPSLAKCNNIRLLHQDPEAETGAS